MISTRTYTSPSRHTSGTSAARRVVELAVLGALGAIVADTWILKGALVPLVVDGDSMAPALLGAHRHWRCTACQRSFDCDLDSLPPSTSVICPHCGGFNDITAGSDARGDRLLVDRTAYQWRSPRRWEVVVLQSPESSDMLCVKRVVGLPGETIRIEDGEVLVNGAPARRDLPGSPNPHELREIYYTSGPRGDVQYRLGNEEYFVLGDNSPRSQDSRWWSTGGVPGGLLLGPALAW